MNYTAHSLITTKVVGLIHASQSGQTGLTTHLFVFRDKIMDLYHAVPEIIVATFEEKRNVRPFTFTE